MTAAATPPEGFITQAADLGIAFDQGDVERLGAYLELLLDTNQHFNLTAVTDPQQAWMRHVLDSLTLVPLLASLQAQRVIDVGSGGGLPGIPLAIVQPQVQFALLEATGKKASFLQHAAQQLGLGNVTVINDRAETVGQDREHHREQYDVVLARAVGRLSILLELTVPLATVGGHVLAMKGERASEEIEQAKAALHLLHAHVIDRMVTPTGTIVVIQKQRATPRVYPRRAGEPKRMPLGEQR
jgi:16S rRNA (guanine527-N7)-methyltransferase